MRFLRFQLERWIQRGVLEQLVLVAGIIASISVVGGVVVWIGTDSFSNVFDAIWWAFLRLTDPGYLGDDEGVVKRVVSTVVTVLGYVIFMGSLIAIMTQWLAQTIDRFDRGLGPIVMEGHIVVIGWTNRTLEIVRELMIARGRLRRFLAKQDQRVLRVVIVALEVTPDRRRQLRNFLGKHYRSRQIFFRSGSEISRGELARFDLARAGAVIIPGDEFRHGDIESADVNMIKMLVALRSTLGRQLVDGEGPQFVAELFDPRKAGAARGILGDRCSIISGDTTIATLMVQAIRDPRLLAVFLELLSHVQGCTLYVKGFPELAGIHPAEANHRFAAAVVIGVLRPEVGGDVTHLNPPEDFRLERDDKLVMVAGSSESLVLEPSPVRGLIAPRRELRGTVKRTRTVLVLGLSTKIGSMLEELGRTNGLEAEVTVVTRHSEAEQSEMLEGFVWDPARVRVERIQADYTSFGVLDGIGLQRFDTILLLSSVGMPSAADADARAIMGYEMVKAVLAERSPADGRGPDLIVEFVDPTSADLLDGDAGIRVLSPRILAHLESHSALHPDLGSVFTELFVGGGVEMVIREAGDYGCEDGATFDDVGRAAAERGEIAIGCVIGGAVIGGFEIELCPPSDRRCDDAAGCSIVALATE